MKTIIEHKDFNNLNDENSYVSTMLDTHNLVYRTGGCALHSDQKPYSDCKNTWNVEYCWAAKPQRYPIAFHTVDIAVYRITDVGVCEFLMIQKEVELGSGLWRFPGGFMDPRETAENAASRELKEETHLEIPITSKNYLGSFVINDSRYKDTPDGITTSFFGVECNEQSPAAGDDAAAIAWIPINDLVSVCNPIHLELAKSIVEPGHAWDTINQ